jgi:uncharacterized protein YpuA (DUF1002 family)
MGKTYFFLGAVRTHPEDEIRMSREKDYQVAGGSKADHEKAVEIVQEVSKEFRKDPPQTPGEERMIMLDVLKKIG